MSSLPGSVVGVRPGPPRNRRDRGLRGPLVLPGPLSPHGPATPSRREAFDALVVSLVEKYLRRWPKELSDIEFGTEDVPTMPPDWGDEPVPFGALTRPRPGEPGRIVVFRRPVEMRARTRLEQTALVNEILVEHLADLLGRDPGEIDG